MLKQSEGVTETGVNGKELGSNAYFKDLNEKSKISEIMIRADSTVYYESLKEKNQFNKSNP